MRKASHSDLKVLSSIYYRAVDRQLRDFCGEAQIDYYLRFARDESKFDRFIEDAETWIFEVDAVPVGFCGFQADGHISSLYVDPDHSRKGIGSALVRHVIMLGSKTGIDRVFTEANSLSRHFFEKNGFAIISEETRYRNGIPFKRYNMEFEG